MVRFSLFEVSVLMLVFGFAFAEEVEFFPCTSNKTILQQCTIKKVNILPCPEAREVDPEPCRLEQGSNSSVIFDFVPNFTSKSLYAQAYSETFIADLPLPGQNTNACLYTSCPTVPEKQQTLTFSLPIKNYYPQAYYTSKWKVWNEKNEQCCFKVKIQIVSS